MVVAGMNHHTQVHTDVILNTRSTRVGSAKERRVVVDSQADGGVARDTSIDAAAENERRARSRILTLLSQARTSRIEVGVHVANSR